MNQLEFNKKVYSLRDQLFRFARRILSNSDEANDSIQDVMLKLWDKRSELKNMQSIPSYAYAITRNACYDKLKHLKIVRENEVELSNQYAQPIIAINEESERLEYVRRIIKSLPELQRKIIHLRDVEEQEMDEICRITGLKENAVRVNLSRARKKVRDEITKIYSYGLSEYI